MRLNLSQSLSEERSVIRIGGSSDEAGSVCSSTDTHVDEEEQAKMVLTLSRGPGTEIQGIVEGCCQTSHWGYVDCRDSCFHSWLPSRWLNFKVESAKEFRSSFIEVLKAYRRE